MFSAPTTGLALRRNATAWVASTTGIFSQLCRLESSIMVLASLVSPEAFLSGLQMAPFSPCPVMRHGLPSMPRSVAFSYAYLWLCWVLVAECGCSLGSASRGLSSRTRASCRGFSCCRGLALELMGFSSWAHGLSCPMTCGVFPTQRSDPSPLHWQVDS